MVVARRQDVARIDAAKAANMFRKVYVRILGLVENMSYYLCSSCGHRDEIFGAGGGERESKRLDTPLLGRVPLVRAVREGGDSGSPIVEMTPDSEVSQVFMEIARQVAERAVSQSKETGPVAIH